MALANGFVERMQTARDCAAHKRHRGLATGGKARLHARHNPEISARDRKHEELKAYWTGRMANAQEAYNRAAFPERYEGLGE